MKTVINSIIALLFLTIMVKASAMPSRLQLTAHASAIMGRAIEIRYTKMVAEPGKELPKEIKVDDVVYPLYKSKKEAHDAVKEQKLKRDITIVYVISDVEKETEFITIEE